MKLNVGAAITRALQDQRRLDILRIAPDLDPVVRRMKALDRARHTARRPCPRCGR